MKDTIAQRVADLGVPPCPPRRDHMAAAFDRWMDDFINRPEQFERLLDSAVRHLSERLDGQPHSYGEDCAAILREYLGRVACES